MKTNLDIFLEPAKPVGQVELCGQTYELLNVDIMENFLSLLAMKDAVSERFESLENPAISDESEEDKTAMVVREMEALRDDLRRMIRMLVPALPEEILKEKFPKLEQLLAVFQELLKAAMDNLPETVKKNSVTGTKRGILNRQT